jgi:microcystin-dependent protein
LISFIPLSIKKYLMFTNPTLSTITLFAGNTAPNGWMFCQGQLLSPGEFAGLYSIIGTTYGGDGNTFALPDLRGRAAVSAGQAPGMDNYDLGQQGGNEQIIFNAAQLNHSHAISGVDLPAPPASNLPGTTDIPTGNVPAVVAGAPAAYNTTSSNISLGSSTTFTTSGATGNANPEPINIIQPYLAMNYIICVEGAYPPGE